MIGINDPFDSLSELCQGYQAIFTFVNLIEDLLDLRRVDDNVDFVEALLKFFEAYLTAVIFIKKFHPCKCNFFHTILVIKLPMRTNGLNNFNHLGFITSARQWRNMLI